MDGLIGTSRILWDLNFKDKPWDAMANSFGFLEPSRNDSPQVRRVGEEVTRSGIDQYSYPQIRDQPNKKIWGVKGEFGFQIP